MSFGGLPDEAHQDSRTAAAVDFTRKFVHDHHAVEDDDFSLLQAEFTEEEIAALCAFMAFIGGANRFGQMVGLTAADGEGK